MAWWSSRVPLWGLASQGWCTRPLGYLHSLFSKEQLPLSTVYLLFLIIQSVFSLLLLAASSSSSWNCEQLRPQQHLCVRQAQQLRIQGRRVQPVHQTHFHTTGQQDTFRFFPCRFVSNSETSCFPQVWKLLAPGMAAFCVSFSEEGSPKTSILLLLPKLGEERHFQLVTSLAGL